MNILHISPNYNYACGVSKHVFLLLKEFKKQNKHCLFFITNGGDSLTRLSDIGIKPTVMKFKKDNLDMFSFIQFTIGLFLFCKKNNIDVIHTHHRVPELAAVIVSYFLKIKTITTVQSFVYGKKCISFKSDYLISVSNAITKHLVGYFQVKEYKISTIYYFLPEYKKSDENEISETKNKMLIDLKDIVLLFVGRINEIKGCDVLLNVFVKITSMLPNMKLLLIGDIYLKDNYLNIIDKNQNIIYLKPTESISKYFDLSDIIILPSKIDPFPNVMLEAGLARKPFIGGRTGGIKEFIEDGVDGLLVEPGNEKDLLEKIMLLVKDEKLRGKLASNLYSKVQKLPTANDYINFIEKIYAETIN